MSDPRELRHRQQLIMVATSASILADLDIPGMIADIARAEALGPLLDAKAWKDRHAQMEQDKEMLTAALPLWRFGQKLKELADGKKA